MERTLGIVSTRIGNKVKTKLELRLQERYTGTGLFDRVSIIDLDNPEFDKSCTDYIAHLYDVFEQDIEGLAKIKAVNKESRIIGFSRNPDLRDMYKDVAEVYEFPTEAYEIYESEAKAAITSHN